MEDIAKAYGYISAIVFPSMFEIRDFLSANGMMESGPDVLVPETCPSVGGGFSWKEHSEVFEMFGWDEKFVEEFLMTGGVTSGEWFAQRKSIYENVLAKADMLVKLNSDDRDVKVGNLVKGLLTSLDMECSPPRLVAASLIIGSFLTGTLCGENTADLKSAGLLNTGLLGKMALKWSLSSLNAVNIVHKMHMSMLKRASDIHRVLRIFRVDEFMESLAFSLILPQVLGFALRSVFLMNAFLWPALPAWPHVPEAVDMRHVG